MHYTPLVEYIARKLAYSYHDLEDLVQVGTIGLLRSLDRYKMNKEVDFTSFATPNIIGEIKHYFRDKSRIVKVPRKLQELYAKVRQYIRSCQLMGRSPTISEIAEALDITEEKILESMEAAQSTFVLSLDAPNQRSSSPKDGSSSSESLLDKIGVDGKEEGLLNKETLKQALIQLGPREKKIVFLRFYIGLSQTEIAKKLNLSQMHISRLLTNALVRLRKMIDNGG